MKSRFKHERYTVLLDAGHDENELTIVDLAAGDWKPRTIVSRMGAEWFVIGNDESKPFLVTR